MSYRHGLKRRVRGDVGECGQGLTSPSLEEAWSGLGSASLNGGLEMLVRVFSLFGVRRKIWGPPWDSVAERAPLLPSGLLRGTGSLCGPASVSSTNSRHRKEKHSHRFYKGAGCQGP